MSKFRGVWKRTGKRSGLEKRVEENLKLEFGIRYEYEDRKYRYVKLLCPCCGGVASEGTYTPDFSIYRANGESTDEPIFTIEVKGRFDSEDRSKLLAVREANPGIDLRLLFQRDDPIRKGSKTRYTTWCEKHKFDYHIGGRDGELPTRWFK